MSEQLQRDPVERLEELKVKTREHAISVQELKICQEKLSHCYRLHGVNHHEMCKDIVDEYAALIKLGQRPSAGAPPE